MSANSLTAADLDMFAKLRISPELLELAGIARVTDREARVADGSLHTIMVGGRRLVPIGEVERIERDGLVKQAR